METSLYASMGECRDKQLVNQQVWPVPLLLVGLFAPESEFLQLQLKVAVRCTERH